MGLYKEVEPTVSSETEIMFEMLWHCGFIHSGWSSDLNKMWPDMISRSLGPEFGGSIGLMFFLAKVCACGEYVLGLVEAILDVFGLDPGKFLSHFLFLLCVLHWLAGRLCLPVGFISFVWFLSFQNLLFITFSWSFFAMWLNWQLSHIANWCEEQH